MILDFCIDALFVICILGLGVLMVRFLIDIAKGKI